MLPLRAAPPTRFQSKILEKIFVGNVVKQSGTAVSEVAGHTNSLNFYGQNVEIRRPGADQRRESMSNPEPSSASQIHTTNRLLPGPIKDFLKINSNLISLNFKI